MTTSAPNRVSSRTVASLICGPNTCWTHPVSKATRSRVSPSAGTTPGRATVAGGGNRLGAIAKSGRMARGIRKENARPTLDILSAKRVRPG